jgi:enamine deaminase RidA (YjgF/YER057c/UK114 family)
MSQTVIHQGVVYLAGQVGTADDSVADQTHEILAKIDALLAEAGSDKTKLLRGEIWLTDIRNFAEMNEVWDTWVPEGHTPARACGECRQAAPGLEVEIIITAAC